MRVAIVHYWLIDMRGGEKVVEALCDMYPDADIFTLVHDRSKVSEKINRHRIFTSFLQKIPGALKHYQSLLPLMPFAIESFDLTGYDLIISSESGPAKGIIPPPHATHVCYCHSPMRYLWDHYHGYRATSGRLTRMVMPVIAPLLRSWDANTSLRVDRFVANSSHVAARINKYYRRNASVIFPPVSVEDFSPVSTIGDFYLCAGQIVPYKRIDLAVRAFNTLGKRLVIIGGGKGSEIDALKQIAGPNIEFLGKVPFETLKTYLASCRALVFPGEEDFGMVPVEAMASGRPVIAYGSGGAVETVIHGRTGMLFGEQTEDALVEAVEDFENAQDLFDPVAIRAHAMSFGPERFRQAMADVIDRELGRKKEGRNGFGVMPLPPRQPERRPAAPVH